MGTIPEWTQVLEAGVIFAATLLLLDVMTDREDVAKFSNLYATGLSSLVVGMIDVFRWRVLHGAIGVMFIGVLILVLGGGFAFQRARRNAASKANAR